MNIYIHLENIIRELDSKLLLATLAASRGHEVIISNIEAIEKGIRRGLLAPGIFHTKSLTPGPIKISNHKEGILYLEPLKGDVKESKADTRLTMKTFNWNYLINLEEGLKTLIENPEFTPFFEKFFFFNSFSKKSTQDKFLLSQKPLFDVDPPKIQISPSLL